MLGNYYCLHSRAHPLNHFPSGCYVKRDDELSCGISGSKLRKYDSLIPWILENNIEKLIIIAGAQSNNLLAALQVARELSLHVHAFLIKPRQLFNEANYSLSRLLLKEDEISWVAREHWPKVEAIAEDYKQNSKAKCFVLNEGASVVAARAGAETLADDILLNEEQLAIKFHHIFVDAGTGFSAASLAYRLQVLRHPAIVHVLLLAEDQACFEKVLIQWLGSIPDNIRCFYPDTARSFGAVNQSIKNEIRKTAMEEGILLDPIYSAKLFYSVRKKLMGDNFQGNRLIIHSGGVLSLTGFEL